MKFSCVLMLLFTLTLSARTPFIPDTTITISDTEVPVTKHTLFKEETKYMAQKSETYYCDSLERILLFSRVEEDTDSAIIITTTGQASLSNSGSLIERWDMYIQREFPNSEQHTCTLLIRAYEWDDLGRAVTARLWADLYASVGDTTDLFFEEYAHITLRYGEEGKMYDIETDSIEDGFLPDRFIYSGDVLVPVKRAGHKGKWNCGYNTSWVDVKGRHIKSRGETGGGQSKTSSSKSMFLLLNEDDNVVMQLYNSGSSFPGGVSYRTDTLLGKTWNSLGMITKGYLKELHTGMGQTTLVKMDILIAYDTTDLIAIDTFNIDSAGFQPDTLIVLGDRAVPVTVTQENGERTCRDSLSRVLQSESKTESHIVAVDEWYTTRLNERDQINRAYYYRKAKLMDGHTSRFDTLYDICSWNEQGMATQGLLRRLEKTGKQGSADVVDLDTLYKVTISYEESGIIPKDTLFEAATPLLKSVPKRCKATVEQRKQNLYLRGVHSNTPIELYSISGRKVMHLWAGKDGEVTLPLSGFAPGVYLLQVAQQSYKVRIQ